LYFEGSTWGFLDIVCSAPNLINPSATYVYCILGVARYNDDGPKSGAKPMNLQKSQVVSRTSTPLSKTQRHAIPTAIDAVKRLFGFRGKVGNLDNNMSNVV